MSVKCNQTCNKKIISDGFILEQIKFTCDNCGTVFVSSSSWYTYFKGVNTIKKIKGMGILKTEEHWAIPSHIYRSSCPNCASDAMAYIPTGEQKFRFEGYGS